MPETGKHRSTPITKADQCRPTLVGLRSMKFNAPYHFMHDKSIQTMQM